MVSGEDSHRADEVATIYTNRDAKVLTVSPASAEIIKYVNKSWHASKVAFGNEVGQYAKCSASIPTR